MAKKVSVRMEAYWRARIAEAQKALTLAPNESTAGRYALVRARYAAAGGHAEKAALLYALAASHDYCVAAAGVQRWLNAVAEVTAEIERKQREAMS